MKQNVQKHNIDYVKRLAKKVKKEENLTHHEALNLVAQDIGFKNWKHLLNETKDDDFFKDLSVISINELRGLNLNGFDSFDSFDSKSFSENKKIESIRIEIRKYFTKRKSFNFNRSSYGLKHDLERHIEKYVSNGELIYAMYLEGFQIKRDGINCYFNLSNIGLKNLTVSNKILKSLNTSWEYELEDYLNFRKKFRKYKYHFNLIIRLLLHKEVSKRYIYGVIAAEIGETPETVKNWFDIKHEDRNQIPREALKSLSKIFRIKPRKLRNRVQL